MIKTEQLRYLLELDKTKSFHKCAENLYLSQPAISLSIRNLEKELGVTLFTRTSTGVYPTDIGSEIIQQAKKILVNLNEIYLLCDKHQSKKHSDFLNYLKFYSTNSFSSVILPYLVPTLQKEFPHANFSFYEYNFEELFSQIAENPYSIGFHYGWAEEEFTALDHYSNVKMQPLYDISFYLATAKTAAFRPKEAIYLHHNNTTSPIPLVTYTNHAEVTQQVIQKLTKENIVQITLQAPSTGLFYSYLEQGLAAGVILKLGNHKFISSIDLESIAFIPIEIEKSASLFLLYHQNLPNYIRQLLLHYLDTYFELL